MENIKVTQTLLWLEEVIESSNVEYGEETFECLLSTTIKGKPWLGEKEDI